MFEWIKTASDDLIAEKFSRRFGEGGVTEYYYALCELLAAKNSGFGGQEYTDYQSKKSDLRADVATANVNDLQSVISQIVIDTLKKTYGVDELPSGEKAYWERGIENAEIKQNAYKKQQQTALEKRAPKEAYLDLIDFDKIIRQKGNWEHLETLLSIPISGVNPKAKTYHLDWLTELNEIRRVSAHKSVYRQYSEDNYKFIEWLKKELYARCEAAGIDLQ